MASSSPHQQLRVDGSRSPSTYATRAGVQAAADHRVRLITSSLLLAAPGDAVLADAGMVPITGQQYARGNPYAPRDGDQILDDFFSNDADDEAIDRDVIEQVWAFRATSAPRKKPTKRAVVQPEPPSSFMMTITSPEASPSDSPSRGTPLLTAATPSATPFTAMRRQLSNLSDAASAQSLRLGDWPTPAPSPKPEVGTFHVEVPIEQVADIKIMSPVQSPMASPISSPLLSPLTPPQFPMSPGGTHTPTGLIRDALTDLSFAARQARKLGARTPAASPKLTSDSLPSIVRTVLLAHGLADARHRRREEEEARTLDLRKEIAHAQYMKLVIRHVRTRLIQEGRFIEDTPPDSMPLTWEGDVNQFEAQMAIRQRDRWRGDLPATAASHRRTSSGLLGMQMPTVERSALPIDQLDVHMEITGKPRPIPPPTPVPVPKRTIRSSPILPSHDHPPPQPLLSPYSRAKEEAAKPDPLDPLPFFIDPLDPELPENAHKRYKQNQSYEVPHTGEWPLNRRGPTNTWQELSDEEELAAYKKVLWLCEIKALSHVPLDGMLEIIQLMVERAFDVEVLLRAGDPADPTGALGPGSVFFVKSGEVELRMDRRVVEEMEEQRLLAGLLSSSSSHESNLSMHAHPQPSLQPQPQYSHHRLSTDPDLLSKAVEIAKLGPYGICGEDIMIASHRRYTVLSVTPVWLYEIKSDALIRCFGPEAGNAFLLAIAHTQRVRERHALVKSRTRLQYHAAPTMFHHFNDQPLTRQLGRKSQRPTAADAASSPLRGGLRTEVMLTGGGPDALRAVLQDLNSISAASALHKYVPHSPQRIEQLVAHAAHTKDRNALAQRDLMKERQKTEARGGNAALLSPSKAAAQEEKQQVVSPVQLGSFNFTPSASVFTSPQVAAPIQQAAQVQARGTASAPQLARRQSIALPPPQFDTAQPTPGQLQRRSSVMSFEPRPMQALEEIPATPAAAVEEVRPSHQRRITHLVTASGQSMYDSPFKTKEGSPVHLRRLSRSLSSSFGLPTVTEPPPQPTTVATVVTTTVTSPPVAVVRQMHHISSPHSSSSSSPFSMKFQAGSVFEKSSIHSRPGLVSFNATKQHVKRHTVIPLRTQTSAIVILGDVGLEQDYSELAASHHDRRSVSPVQAQRQRRQEAVIAEAHVRQHLLRASASLPALHPVSVRPATIPQPATVHGKLR